MVETGLYVTFAATEQTQGILKPAGKLGQLVLAAICTYLLNQILLKASMALFFLRVVNQRWQKTLILTTLGLYSTFLFVFFWIILFKNGLPTAKNLLAGAGHFPAGALKVLNYIAAVANVLVDWIFTITPIFVVAKALMPMRAKVTVCALILVGALGSASSIVRIPFIEDFTHVKTTNFFSTIEPIALASIVETSMGLIAISLATLRPLFSQCMGLSTIRRTTKKSTSASAQHTFGPGGITRRTEFEVESDLRDNVVYEMQGLDGSEDALTSEGQKEAKGSIAVVESPHASKEDC